MYKVYHCSKEFRLRAESLGFGVSTALTKRIPSVFNQADKESCAAILRGLFTTDGSISYCRTSNTDNTKISYCSVSEELCNQVQQMLLRFGIKSRVSTQEPYTGHIRKCDISCSKSYHLRIQGAESLNKFMSEIGFGLERKNKEVLQSHSRDLLPG